MALRNIRLLGDEMLTKSCREVKEVTPRIEELIEDLLETMYEANGVGLAAPQVGVLRRVAVIDVWQDDIMEDEEAAEDAEGEGAESEGAEPEETSEAAEHAGAEPDAPEEEPNAPAGDEDEWEETEMEGPLILINPVITYTEGEQTGNEGCLSYPGKTGKVTRPNIVRVSYFDENMDEYELEAEGLLARAICHEVDHLDGHMYVELVEGEIHDVGEEPDNDEETEDVEEDALEDAQEN